MPVLAKTSEEFGVTIPTYGHAADGNLHATPVKDPAMSEEQWHEMLPKVLKRIYEAVGRLGGTISGEHGIGSKRREFLPLVLDDVTINLMRRVKEAFDPQGILNPGKIF